MKWEELLHKVADEPVFRTGFLAASDESLAELRRELSRWVRSGRLIQLKKGLYTLAAPYRKVTAHPFVLANAMKKASYVSTQSALAYYGMIPEYVPAVISVTTQRPEQVETSLGRFVFRHIKSDWFHNYKQTELGSGQKAFVASPEKALLDLVYLTAGADNYDFLAELRLQNFEQLDMDRTLALAEKSQSPKLCRAAEIIVKLAEEEKGEEL
jgi:predicted transcriptional regulator of viral defense system